MDGQRHNKLRVVLESFEKLDDGGFLFVSASEFPGIAIDVPQHIGGGNLEVGEELHAQIVSGQDYAKVVDGWLMLKVNVRAEVMAFHEHPEAASDTFEISWDGEVKITEVEQKILKGDELISLKAGPVLKNMKFSGLRGAEDWSFHGTGLYAISEDGKKQAIEYELEFNNENPSDRELL